jgi:hypothetical protein
MPIATFIRSLTGPTGYTGYSGPAGGAGGAGATGYTGYTGYTGPSGRSFGASFDGGGSALAAGMSSHAQTLPFAGTIAAWNITLDAGTATVKVWKIATGTAIPTVANVINTSGIAISSGTAVHSTTLTDFTTTTVTANDIVIINITAVSSATKLNVTISY